MTLRIRSMADLPAHHRVNQLAKEIGPLLAPDMPRKRSKYRNEPVIEDGQRFDSKLEARCYRGLKLSQERGFVRWFIRQVPFRLEGGVVYRADFLVVYPSGAIAVIDAKGMLTRSSANKIKQVKERYGIEVVLWTGK